MLGGHLKKRILVQGQGGHDIQTGGILPYFEDLNSASSAEIGPKDFFEIASTVKGFQGTRGTAPTSGLFGVWLLAGLLFLAIAGCGVKAPPVSPDAKPPVVAAFDYTLAGGMLTLTWTLSGESPTPQSYTLYRSRTPLTDKACPGCPLAFERIRTIPADRRKSGTTTLPVKAGYHYGFKLTATAENGFEGPDSGTVRFRY